MKYNIRQAEKKDIPQIVDLLIDEIDYVYEKIFPGTNWQNRRTLLTRVLGLVEKHNFLEFNRFYCATEEADNIIGITGLITTEKVNLTERVSFFFKVTLALLKSLSFIQFFRFLLSLYKNKDLFTSDMYNAGYITYIIVNPKFQKKGIGTQLLDFSNEYFKQKGYKEISLVVRSGNVKAIKFFTKQGFKEIKRKSDRFIEQGDKVIMTKNI